MQSKSGEISRVKRQYRFAQSPKILLQIPALRINVLVILFCPVELQNYSTTIPEHV